MMSNEQSPQSPPPNGKNEFYVGYLPVPAKQRRFLRMVVPPLLLGLATAAVLLAATFRSPGNAQWRTEQLTTLEGTLTAHPYAMIAVASDNPDKTDAHPPHLILLVQEGKRGARELAMPFDGKQVRIRGHILERDGLQQLLELTGPIEAMADGASPNLSCESVGPIALRGEIIDPKCYLGAMKPGEGKTHKECGTLCIAGGIPPMFVVRSHTGTKAYYLLTDEHGAPANSIVLPYVADPVEITGTLERWADLNVVKLTAGGIRRL